MHVSEPEPMVCAWVWGRVPTAIFADWLEESGKESLAEKLRRAAPRWLDQDGATFVRMRLADVLFPENGDGE